jgi:dolichol kinase
MPYDSDSPTWEFLFLVLGLGILALFFLRGDLPGSSLHLTRLRDGLGSIIGFVFSSGASCVVWAGVLVGIIAGCIQIYEFFERRL